jgi:predicted ATPase
MKLQFQSEYKSIKSLETVELPSFSVITGLNGTGKTHLLEAISNGNIRIISNINAKICRFNYETFKLDNEKSLNSMQARAQIRDAWKFVSEQAENGFVKSIESNRKMLGSHYEKLVSISQETGVPFLSLNTVISDGDLAKVFEKYKKNVEISISRKLPGNSNPHSDSIRKILYGIHKSFDELSEHEFIDSYEPVTLKQDFLPIQLTRIFMNYYYRYDENRYKRYLNEVEGCSYPVISDGEFIFRYGPKPWDLVNSILQSIKSVKFRVNSPEGLDRDSTFNLRLSNEALGVSDIPFSDLSSGETVLMALAASVYKNSSDGMFPDVLLLDEIDASLHPSMIKSMIDIVIQSFVENKTEVILVTHSPTTIALVPEGSVFLLNPEPGKRLDITPNSKALNVLTEGFATLEQGIRLFSMLSADSTLVLTEGKNVEYLKIAFDLFGLENVHVLEGMEARSGMTQLATLFEFFQAIPHDYPVVFVWDCDAYAFKTRFSSVNNTYPFIFDKNEENNVCKKGIENLLPISVVGRDRFMVKVKKGRGGVSEYFDEDTKGDLLKFVEERKLISDFEKFKPLINFIEGIER